MKHAKTATVSARIDTKIKSALHKKVKAEYGHNLASVMRHLITLYLTDKVTLPAPTGELQ